jgi:hypothetical protein
MSKLLRLHNSIGGHVESGLSEIMEILKYGVDG